MAKVRVGVLCRLLGIVAALVLALPTVAHGVRGGLAALAPPALSATAPAGPRTSQPAVTAHEHPDSVAVHCQQRHGGRSAATVSAPMPLSTPLSTSCPVRTVGGLTVTGPQTGRQAVPLSRSGELPVRHRSFRC
ncbi:hypothetical protein AB0I10_39740 [Streptomyces sp. NPDC050636]|uniref:hypothetical protein n=1 Tax=Streptomyces sp. NPDC050636 TaxID=3154510 RepID=UPI0034330FFD